MISRSIVSSIIKYEKLINKSECLVELIENQNTTYSIRASCGSINIKTETTRDYEETKHTSLSVSICSSISDGSYTHRRKGVPKRSSLC